MYQILILVTLGFCSYLHAYDYKFIAITKDHKERALAMDMSLYVSENLSRDTVIGNNDGAENCTATNKIYDSDQKIILSSESFGPLPVKLQIFTKEKKLLHSKINENNLRTYFEIPVSTLSKESRLMVFNGLDEIIFCKKLKKYHQRD